MAKRRRFSGKKKRTHFSKKDLITLIGINPSKYYDWNRRYGDRNEHNSPIPRWFWLLDWEKEAIVQFHDDHPLEGYRRLTYMMIGEDGLQVGLYMETC